MIYVGFDIGGTNIKAGLVNSDACIEAKRSVPFLKGNYKKTADVMAELVDNMLAERGLCRADIAAIGIAVPGSIDPTGSIILDAYNLDFHNVPLKEEIRKRFPDIPVALANDANAAALAELEGGAFRGYRTAVLLTLGTGVGGGVILDGRMFNGGKEHGIELGHMTLIHGGPPCSCGNRGCMETVCTATWLTAQGRKAAGHNPKGLIFQKAKEDLTCVNAKTVMDSAKEGDPEAMTIFDEYVDYLSSAIMSIVGVLDPEVVALGGGVSLAGDFLFEPLRRQVKEKSFYRADYTIVPTLMGNDAGIVGAAMLLKDQK